MDIPETLEVLESIWSRSGPGAVYFPRSRGSLWIEGIGMVFPEVRAQAIERIADDQMDMSAPMMDYYFSPFKYRPGEGRKRESLVTPGLIVADLDRGQRGLRLRPSVLIESSPNHYHGYWFLRHVPRSLEEWEGISRGWTQEIGADPGGWDSTQVLRIPGTLNHKYSPPELVEVVGFNPELRYDMAAFPVASVTQGVGEIFTPDLTLRNNLLRSLDSDALSMRYWLTVTKEELEALGKIDRSSIMWNIERTLIELGYAEEAVFQLVWFSGVNKYKDAGRLSREVHKAALS
jgi:hypothetical protein